jgi:hypothetical protein
MTNYCAGVSGKEIEIIQDDAQIKRETDISPQSRTNIYHLPASWPSLFLIGYYLYCNIRFTKCLFRIQIFFLSENPVYK